MGDLHLGGARVHRLGAALRAGAHLPDHCRRVTARAHSVGLHAHQLTIRAAGFEQAAALRYLADIDSQPRLEGDALLALMAVEPVAAISLANGRVVADPFRPTLAAAELLRLRRRQLTEPARRHHGRAPALIRRVAAALR